jgi:hypothetical protein
MGSAVVCIIMNTLMGKERGIRLHLFVLSVLNGD